jgi:hypothetical protein
MELSELLPQIGSEDPDEGAGRCPACDADVARRWLLLVRSPSVAPPPPRSGPAPGPPCRTRTLPRGRTRCPGTRPRDRPRLPDSTSTVRPLRAEVAALTVLLGLADQRSPASCARPRPQEIPTLWRKGNGVTFPLPAHRRCPCCETGRGTSETRSRRDDAARRLRGRVDRWLWAGKGSYHEGMPKLPGRD